ncbi:Protein of unknown function [Geoalkalibacter ferrihydriticus]|uniref:DUF3793 family protein n=2 Tax=Geoalkalibacter ferrihydriticus TaxID=392333 RepID=A0A0C2HHM6_9BACT|nr:DUF3793 family protein [Geoalkalibacter ferrihydriticus]KIH76501.1 hypothetical protein GFER_09960 [Geoalkalibacter ferrihydriticus DSM 17813]SDL98501.1 Protein of unknown function [Geoalkalibacter ferrihydriticus]
MQQQRSTRQRRPSWHEMSDLFIDEKQCIASFLALETAEILEGAKPANLINMPNRSRHCGRNLYTLWKSHGACLLRQSGLEFREIMERGQSVLLFIYHRRALEQTLARPNVRAFLAKAGHTHTADVEHTLDEMQRRIQSAPFPHEIGALLGYPLKDVAGFMGWAELPTSSGRTPWKIFGAPEKSLRLAEEFLNCRCRMAQRLTSCADPIECLKLARAA